MGDAVKRVSHSRTAGQVGKIEQRHEVYPQWLRHRVSPPKRESMPVFMLTSSDAYLLLVSRHPHSASLPQVRAEHSELPAPAPPGSYRCERTRSNMGRRAQSPEVALPGPAAGGGGPRCPLDGPGNRRSERDGTRCQAYA